MARARPGRKHNRLRGNRGSQLGKIPVTQRFGDGGPPSEGTETAGMERAF